jgi:HD domain
VTVALLPVGRLAVVNADELSATPAAQAALEALCAAAGSDTPMERHSLRQFAIAERLAGERAIDRELLLCACRLHDAGLFTHSRDPYLTEGARLAARVLEPFGWPPERVQRCMDAREQHHAPRSRMEMGLEVELVRQSDLVDVTAGTSALIARGCATCSAKSRRTGSGASSAGRSLASCASGRRASPVSSAPHDAPDHRR